MGGVEVQWGRKRLKKTKKQGRRGGVGWLNLYYEGFYHGAQLRFPIGLQTEKELNL